MMQKKKKLVIATDNFLPRWDGVARFLAEIVSRLKEEYDITIITGDFKGHYNDPSIKIVRFPLRKFHIGDFPPSKPNKRLIRENIRDADIVWVQTIGPIGSKSIKIANSLNKKIVTYHHSIEWELVPNAIGNFAFMKLLYFLTKRIARKLYNKCDVLFVPTKEVSEKLSKHKIFRKKIVIPLGVDTETFIPAGRKNSAKLAIGIDPDSFVIGYVGRIGREKDLKTLFRAFIRIKKVNDKVKLLIVGDGIESLKEMFSSRDGVIVTGQKDNVIPFYHAMDVYAITSLTETTSLSTLEAMSCGLPVIATKVGYMKEYVVNGKNGYLIRRQDPYSIYRRVVDIIKDPLLGPKLGKKARETVVSDFSWEKTVEKIKEELGKI